MKVRRPEFPALVRADVDVVRSGAFLLEQLPTLRDIPIRDAVEEIVVALHQQMDFTRERDNNKLFQDMFADTPSVRVPRVLDEYSNNEVLVMEYIDGIRRLDDDSISLKEFEQAARLALHCVYRMIFVEGVIHCDLHPSNLCLIPGGVVLLDTGFVSRLNTRDRLRFRAFFAGVAYNDDETCTRILVESALSRKRTFDERAFRADVRRLIGQNSAALAGDFQVTGFVRDLFKLQRNHGLRGSPKFTMAIAALLVVEGVIRHRLPDLDFQRAAVPYLGAGLLVTAQRPV